MTRDEIERRAHELLPQIIMIARNKSAEAALQAFAAAMVALWDEACDQGIKVVDEGWELWEIKDQLRAKKLGGQR